MKLGSYGLIPLELLTSEQLPCIRGASPLTLSNCLSWSCSADVTPAAQQQKHITTAGSGTGAAAGGRRAAAFTSQQHSAAGGHHLRLRRHTHDADPLVSAHTDQHRWVSNSIAGAEGRNRMAEFLWS